MAITLANVDDKGAAPEARIKDAAAAFKVYGQIEQAWNIKLANQGIVDDEIAGAPPNNPDDMIEAGLGQMSNFNPLQSNADDAAAVSAYVALNDATAHLMGVRTTYGEDAERFEWEEKINTHLDWLLKKRYAGFHQNEQLLATWYTRDAFGIVYWPHDIDWRWKVGRLGQFMFPVDASVDESQLDIAVFVEDKTPPELFQMLRKSKAVTDKADKTAVNQKEVIKAIQDCGGNSTKAVTYSDLESRFSGNMVGEAYGTTQRITIVHLYVREFPSKTGAAGRVSHYIIRADGKCKEFLYQKRHAFPCMEEMMTFYADGVGTGTIGSLQGQIARSFPIYIAKSLLLNKWHDRTTLALNLYMKGDGTQGSTELLSQQSFGSITVLNGKVEFVEMPGGETGAQCTPLLAELNRIGANNNGAYQSHAISPEGGERTLGEVNLQAAASAQMQNSKFTNRYLAQQKRDWNVIRRLQNPKYTSADPGWTERMEFFKRLQEDGVPLQAFFDVVEVTPMRAVGYGSFQARQAAFGTLNGLRGFMDPTGQANLNRDMAAAGGAGYDNAARYFPAPAQPRTPLDQQIADLQNAAFVGGVPQPVYPDQNHAIHAVEHDKFANGLVQQANQGAIAPPDALKALGAVLDHQKAKDPQAGQLGHLDYMEKAGDATQKGLLKALQKSHANLTKQFQAMQEHVQEMQQAQQPPAPTDPQLPPPDPDLMKAQAEIARNDAKAKAQIARDDAKAHAHIATTALEAGAAAHPGPIDPLQPPASPAVVSPQILVPQQPLVIPPQ